MLTKTLAAAIRKWPSTDLAELLALIGSEIHSRAERQREAERTKGRKLEGRSSHGKESRNA
jgi:hypothetical protein